MPNPGDVIDARYVVERLLGEGGLAQVYQVRHRDLGSQHALKILLWKKASLTERLLLEGRIQAQLRHPNIVAVTDLVHYDGQVGLLMEFISGHDLDTHLDRDELDACANPADPFSTPNNSACCVADVTTTNTNPGDPGPIPPTHNPGPPASSSKHPLHIHPPSKSEAPRWSSLRSPETRTSWPVSTTNQPPSPATAPPNSRSSGPMTTWTTATADSPSPYTTRCLRGRGLN